MFLTTSQKKTVEKLFDAFLKKKNYKFASFKAPTGAGKTFMASEFISRVFSHEIGNELKTVFVVATVSNAKLPKQFTKKLEKYREFHEFNNYIIEHIESPTTSKNNKFESMQEFVLEDNKVFIFGTSSFGKKTLFFQNKVLETFIRQAKNLRYQIFFIRDEAHIGSKEKIGKTELKSFDNKMRDVSSFVIEMTATPKDKKNLIEMTRDDMANDGFFLLKENMMKTMLHDEITNQEIINDAISTFLDVKKKYQKLEGVVINPAILVQVMNESNYEKDPIKNQLFHEGINLLEKKLCAAGLKYLKYLSNSEVVGANLPNTLEYASKIDSQIDAIIFKVGPATGWDIPRACMLLQLRNVSSESLNIQTLGRIMRNPYPNLIKKCTTNSYYVWSNYQKPNRENAIYKLKDQFKKKDFFAGFINKKDKTIIRDKEKYRSSVFKFLDSSEFLNKIKDINPKKDIIYDFISYGKAIVRNSIPNYVYLKIYNLKKAREFEHSLSVSLFRQKLNKIAISNNTNIEIIKYIFFSFILKFNEIKYSNSKWIKSYEPYKLLEDAKTKEFYVIWVDNENPKMVNTSIFQNYGYIQISKKEDIQYLDSTSEYNFFKKFDSIISSKQREEIKFFAKMPTWGSQVCFEYYSFMHGAITKSFMDFAIEYKDKIIMIEVKSKDEDYSWKKTQELLNAYKIYMDKFNEKNLHLILYQYDKTHDAHQLHMMINNEWKDYTSFKEAFDYLLI